jgi:hypothetical protein
LKNTLVPRVRYSVCISGLRIRKFYVDLLDPDPLVFVQILFIIKQKFEKNLDFSVLSDPKLSDKVGSATITGSNPNPDPDLTFLTRKLDNFCNFFLQIGPIRL